MIDDVKLTKFNEIGDNRGRLVVIEGLKDIPFRIERVFYIYGSSKDVIRGQHANKESEFILVNVRGTSKVKVTDGKHEKIFILDKPHMGVYIPKMIWKEMYDFSEDSILLCLASKKYDAAEYIRDYNSYLNELKISELK